MSSDEQDSEGDDDLKEVDSFDDPLLKAIARAPRPDARALVASALPALADTFDAEGEARAGAPPIGTLIDGRYRLDEVLGSGGMGVVFGATHLSTGRKVALKWMLLRGLGRTASEREASARRFLREAQAAGRIRHPNVVDVHDAGTDPSAPYLVMERLDGETLRARMDRGAMSWDETLNLMLPAMEGIREAHRKGVVHRDIKPDNIFLASVAGAKEVIPKVLDFGVSRLHESDSLEPSLTRTGAVIGTPAYMPLEQLRAQGNIDQRTDIYAIGVVIYEMLTGSRPYVSRNAADLAAQIASKAPVPLAKLRPDLHGTRDAAVMKALSRHPRDRYEDVDAFVAALTEKRSVRRSLRLWTLVLLVLAAVAAWTSQRSEPNALHERAPRRQAVETKVGRPPVPPSGGARTKTPAPNKAHDRAPAQPESPVVEVPSTALPSPQASRARGHAASPATAPRVSPTTLSHEDFRSEPTRKSTKPNKLAPTQAPRPRLDLGRDQF